MKAFPAADDGGEDAGGARLEVLADRIDDGVLGLRDDRDAGFGTILGAELGVEEAQEMVDLGDGCNG